MVSAKSRTSFERATMRRSAIILDWLSYQLPEPREKGGRGGEGTDMTPPHSNHTTPSVHPTVVSPRTARHEKIKPSPNGRPATTAVNRISIVADK